MPRRKYGHKYGLRCVNLCAAGEVIFCNSWASPLHSFWSFPEPIPLYPSRSRSASPILLLSFFAVSAFPLALSSNPITRPVSNTPTEEREGGGSRAMAEVTEINLVESTATRVALKWPCTTLMKLPSYLCACVCVLQYLVPILSRSLCKGTFTVTANRFYFP